MDILPYNPVRRSQPVIRPAMRGMQCGSITGSGNSSMLAGARET